VAIFPVSFHCSIIICLFCFYSIIFIKPLHSAASIGEGRNRVEKSHLLLEIFNVGLSIYHFLSVLWWKFIMWLPQMQGILGNVVPAWKGVASLEKYSHQWRWSPMMLIFRYSWPHWITIHLYDH
jgi:hypothetical protein